MGPYTQDRGRGPHSPGTCRQRPEQTQPRGGCRSAWTSWRHRTPPAPNPLPRPISHWPLTVARAASWHRQSATSTSADLCVGSHWHHPKASPPWVSIGPLLLLLSHRPPDSLPRDHPGLAGGSLSSLGWSYGRGWFPGGREKALGMRRWTTAMAPSCPDPGETWALLDVGGHQLFRSHDGIRYGRRKNEDTT